MGKGPTLPNPSAAAEGGIQADLQNQPFSYLLNAASQLGKPISIGGKTYNFSGLGAGDVAGKISDQLAQTLLDLQKETSPTIIQQRIDELKAADPQGYAARKQLFDRIITDSQAHPERPVATELQKQLQEELAKGTGFDDAKQAEQAREGVRGAQAARGITLGNAAGAEEARSVLGKGEQLRNQRQQNALALLESGASPEDVNYRRMQQSLGNLASFQAGETPTAQFKQVSAAQSGPVSLTGGSPGTNTFNPNAAGAGMQNALGIYNGQIDWSNAQSNPWLAGLSIGATTAGSLKRGGYFNSTPSNIVPSQSYQDQWGNPR